MKTNIARSLSGVLLFAVALVGLPRPAQAGQCTLASVAGSYAYTSDGSVPTVGPFVAVGHVTFAAGGTFSGAQTTSIAGNIFDETVSGTFTVNSDCKGAAVVNVYHSGVLFRTTNLDLVWFSDRKEIPAIFRTPGTAITIAAKRIFNEDD